MRYERKFRTNGIFPQHITAMIKAHPAGFFEAHPPRRVNNLYFDSTSFQRFAESLDGVRDRTKIRIRWYGAQQGRVTKSSLEFKIKRGFLGFKRRFDIEPFTVDTALDRLVFRKLVRQANVPPDLAIGLHSTDITLMNSYKRTYYESKDRKFRLTMDTELQFCDVHRLCNNLLASSIYREEIVLELKYDQMADAEAHRITNRFPLRLTRNSKYANGVERVCVW